MIDISDTPPALLETVRRRPRLALYVLLSAVLATLAFPPVDAGFLAWIALVPLFYALPLAMRPRHAFGLAYLFGILHFGATIFWIGTTVSGWTGSPVGWVAWILLAALKSLWFGLFGLLAWMIARRAAGQKRALATAAAWTCVEWLRGQTNVAMPWSLIGYTQYAYLPLIQIADLAGVYAVSYLIGWSNAAIAAVLPLSEGFANSRPLPRLGKRSAVRASAGPRERVWVLAPSMTCICLTALYGWSALNRSYTGPTARLAMIQPNVGSQWRERKSHEAETAIYRRLEREAAAQAPDLMIWPESTVDDAINDPAARSLFSRFAQQTHAYQLVGTAYADDLRRIYNSAALFAPDGALVDRYDKNWLVPMGEWIPLREWWPFQGVFHYPQVLTRGSSDKVIGAGPIRVCGLICYETVFPILARTRVRAGANLLVCVTNDSWAGESPELQQHIAMSAFRAVETRRCLASSATTGITALIAPTGRIDALSPYREAVLVRSAPLLSGQTLYVRLGDWLVAVCTVGLIILLWPRRKLRESAEESNV